MKTETFDNASDFLAAIKGKKKKAAKNARPQLPRDASDEGDRLSQLIRIAAFGYGPRWDVGVGFSFWNTRTGARTTAHAAYAAACIAAERELTQ